MPTRPRAAVAVLVCASNVIISVVSSCLYYNELYHLSTTPAFATQLNAAMQCTICALGLYALHASGLAPRSGEQKIALRSWFELALWFSLQNTLEIASVDGLGTNSGSLSALLQQAVIPMTLLTSALVLRRRYGLAHVVSAAVVTGGIAAAFAPSISTAGVSLAWVFVFIVSRVPQSLANVRSEQLLSPSHAPAIDERSGVDASHGNAASWAGLRTVLRAGFWTAWLDLLLNIPSSLLLAAAKGEDAFSYVLDDYRDGAMCLTQGHTTNVSASSERCGDAWSAVAVFAIPGALFAVSEFHVLQHTSASTYFLLVALSLPLQATALSMPAVMGSYASPAHPGLLFGVPLIVFGIVCWAAAEWQAAKSEPDRLVATPVGSIGAEPMVDPHAMLEPASMSYMHVDRAALLSTSQEAGRGGPRA